MTEVTVLSDDARVVDATLDDGRILLDATMLGRALGWELKPEGLCRGDVCVPVRDVASLFAGDRVDLAAVARALGRDVVVDTDARVAAVALPAEDRIRALDGLEAPNFTLADLDGGLHDLDEWRGRKKLLLAFASW
ncbi:MAG: hypothetical protein JOZ99_13965 [Actinobacteria bacterium]|nr:hypothetical protein [Actinomycetota bacterium]